MSETASSGTPSAAPSEAPLVPAPSAPAAETPAPAGAFGNYARGTGLARGKRPSPSVADPAAAPASTYKPTSIEVINHQREYKNPFAPEQPAAVPTPEPTPAPVVNAVTTPAEAPHTPLDAAPGATPAPTSVSVEAAPVATPAPASIEEKPELKILPPAESRRVAQSWEQPSAASAAPASSDESRPRRDDRPSFRPAPRDGQPREARQDQPRDQREPRKFEPREPRQPRDPRDQPRDPRDQPRDSREQREPRREFSRESRPNFRQENRAPAPAPVAEKKSGGFFGWLKSLFAGDPAPTETKPETSVREDRGGDRDNREGRDGGHRRRHRGGRGRGGFQGDRGPRDGQPFQHPDPRDEQPREGGDSSGQSHGGSDEQRQGDGFRRRRRGGRGRNRNDHGDRGNDPRSEGTQGGGAI